MCATDAMIPVWKPDGRLRQCVEKLLNQSLRLRKITLMLSVDRQWDDRIIENWFGEEERVEIVRLPRETYNHGGTRRRWAKNSDAKYLLFLVQDAVPEDETLVERMVESLRNERHAVVYARQIPGFGCDEIEAYTRYFNYPPVSMKKTKSKLAGGDVKDCFTSNVCAAYRRDWYERVGGFEEKIQLSEDSVFAAKALKAGGEVIYNADARVIHAHRFGYGTQWKRNFDIGAVHKEYEEIFGELAVKREGAKLVKGTVWYLIRKRKFRLFPRLFLLSAVKFLAYQAGTHYDRLPLGLVRKWSWDQYYWRRD